MRHLAAGAALPRAQQCAGEARPQGPTPPQCPLVAAF